MYAYKPDSSKVHIKAWLDKEIYSNDTDLVEQVERVASLPFVFHHVALAPDAHVGYGLNIGGIAALKNVISPYMVGYDIACGVRFIKTNIKVDTIDKTTISKILDEIKKVVPVGKNWHKEAQDEKDMPGHVLTSRECTIVCREYDRATHQLGTLGGGNHFLELQVSDDGYLCIMIHSGSRNLGKQICDYYNNVAKELNAKWFSSVPKEWNLAFLPFNSEEGQAYFSEMNYAMEFAKCNRALMMKRTKEVISSMFPVTTFEYSLDVHHNYARIENHFGTNVIVHRKGATSARDGEFGIIPGSQGTSSYIVKGKGNPDSFMSCSHGAGRVLGRKEAQRTLNLKEEIKKLDDKGIVHGIRTVKHLDESVSCYKNIEDVMRQQDDLVDITMRLEPLGTLKG